MQKGDFFFYRKGTKEMQKTQRVTPSFLLS